MNGAGRDLPNKWSPTAGAMLAARSNGCAVPLRDGRVLIAGGDGAAGALTSTELLEPSGRFLPAAPTMSGHSGAACALLPDGRVFVAGGRTGGGYTNGVEIYDPSADSWQIGASLPQARADSTVTVLNDGRILLAGGETAGGVSDALEIYDTQTGFQTLPARLTWPRTTHAAALLPDGRVLLVGGWDGARVLDSSDLFDPVSGRVVPAGNMTSARAKLSATTLLGGRVLAFGGSNGQTDLGTAELFDPQTGQWTLEAAHSIVPRSGHVAIAIPHNNTVLFVGGIAAGRNGGQGLAQTEIYVPWRHEFRAAGSLEIAKTAVAAVALTQPGKIAVAGGRNRAGAAQANAETLSAPVIFADQRSYLSGEKIQLSGSGWAPGQQVQLSVPDDSTAAAPETIVSADDSGNWSLPWTVPDAGGQGITIYPTATQLYSGADGVRAFLTARTSAITPAVALSITDCKGHTLSSYGFGTAVCAVLAGLSTKTSAEQMAWSASAWLIYAPTISVAGGRAQDAETPNAAGTWTVKAYPQASCTVSGGITLCSGTPDATATFTVGAGKLAFTSGVQSFPPGGCSGAISVQIQTTTGTAVAPTFPTTVALTTSSTSGQFFSGAGCKGAVHGVTVPAGASSATFYYSDQIASTITATANSLTAASQAETLGLNPPAIMTAFGSGTVPLSGTTTLSFTISNPASNSSSLSGVAFTDTLPAGLAVAATPGLTGSCGGTVSAVAGASKITLAGGTVPQNGSCTITVNVTATVAGMLSNTVQVTSTNGGTGNTATVNLTVLSAVATHFTVSAPASAVAGTAFKFTVTALDSSNKTVTGYSGTVQFTSSDPQAVLPAATTLTNGSATFGATLKTTGTRTLSAADTISPSIAGSAGMVVGAGAPSAITPTGGTPQTTTVSTPFAAPLQATVKDAYGNPVSGVTVTFQAPAGGASAVLQSSTATTGSSGVASLSAAANGVAGSYTVSATIAGGTAPFLLTNMAAAVAPPMSLLLSGTAAGTYSVPNTMPYSGLGSFVIDMRITNWGRLSGYCAPLVQFVTSANHSPSTIDLCDPAYGWGAIRVDEYIDRTPGGDPVWLQAPNIAIASATATNPMTITLTGTPFPAAMSAGRTITIINAAGAGCSGMNANQVITAVSGNTLTLQYDGSGCAYTAYSASALSQDFVFRYHRDLAANQLIGEVWNVDGTGYLSKALTLQTTSPVLVPGTFQIGSTAVTANLAFLRWYSGTIRTGAPAPGTSPGGDLADWEFDGNGNDTSGNHLNITLAAGGSFGLTSTFVATPAYAPACSAGSSRSFHAGQTATLDGSGSFPLDGGNSLTYSWQQIASTEPGVPLQNLTWSSTTAVQPTITGLASGPANFQLTVTQGNGQSSRCTVHHGAVAVDSNGVVITKTGSASLDSAIATLIGPQMQLGTNPWPLYDQAAAADAALQIADMDVHYQDYWNTPGPGTVGVTMGSHIVTGSGTTFTTTFCQGPANPTTPQNAASIIVWYLTGRTINGVQETGRRRMWVTSCASDTELNASLPSDSSPWTSDVLAGSGLNYTPDYYNHLWEFSGAPANFYDNVHAYYTLYYRSGIDTYLAAARKLADRFWTSPEIDRGMAFNVGDWFGAQTGRANSVSGLVLRALDTFDGHADMWAGLHNVWTYTNWLLTQAYPAWSVNGGIDVRETAYTLAQAAYGALWDTDPTWQAYCRSMIAGSLQSGSAGVFPKNVDPLQQAWLQWFQMKSTFDGGQPWSGSTVTLSNGSNLVTCASGNCGWQASDFAAYDVNTTSQCSSGATCATLPVLFTDSATFPANSSHTDPVSYCDAGPCTFIDSNHFTLDRPYAGTSGAHGWVFGVAGGSLGGTSAGVVGWGGLPYMEGILAWSLDLAGNAMACNSSGGPSNCDNNSSGLAYSYSAQAANWITSYGAIPSDYGISFFGGFPTCGIPVNAANVWCNKGYNNIQTREIMGDAYRGLAAVYRRSRTPAVKTMLDNWFAGMWAKPGTNPLLPSPDGQYDTNFDPTGCSGCGFYLTEGAPYAQKFFGQHFGISNEGGWPAVRLGY